MLGLYALFNIPHINQVYMLFRARLLDLDFHAGEETLEARLFTESEIPWDTIAFATVRRTLQTLLQRPPRGRIPVPHGNHRADGEEQGGRMKDEG